MRRLIFLKLGGSLLTDKTGIEVVRHAVLRRLADEIASALAAADAPALVFGHGSGSFGHVAAARYGTRNGARSTEEWRGFAEVSDAAARLNRIVVMAMRDVGIPAISLQPSAAAVADNGRIISMEVEPIRASLRAGLVPVVYGDVAYDLTIGGTIISTEEILSFLAPHFSPGWFLLAGETPGVLDEQDRLVRVIRPSNYAQLKQLLGGSRGTDVTGGMASKVASMLSLVGRLPSLSVKIMSGLEAGAVQEALVDPEIAPGTLILSD